MNNPTQSVFNFLTVDLEDWFHILDIKAHNLTVQNWDILPSNLEQNTERILGLLSEHKVLATFFILGCIADKYPALIRNIDSFGHEIACHGYGHDLIYDLTPQQFREDIHRAKTVIEGIIGKSVKGYRGPGFSITLDNLWAFDIIAEEGFNYDGTVYPGAHAHGGINRLPSAPFLMTTLKGYQINECPATVVGLGKFRIAFSGGGYFRLFPLPVIKWLICSCNSRGVPVMVYIHPRDVDSQTPRLPMSLLRQFKCYVNIAQTHDKLRDIISRHRFMPIRDWLAYRNGVLPAISLKDFVSQGT